MAFRVRSLHVYLGIATYILVQCTVQAKKYRVTTIHHAPFTIINKADSSGNTSYEGFVVDLLKEIGGRLDDVEFEITEVKDQRFGMKDQNGNWNGMIGELVRNESDIAAASLTVTALRATVIKISHPFLNLGLRILVKKPQMDTQVLQRAGVLLHPFGAGVWISIVVSFILVSFVLYGIGRFNPSEEAGETNEGSLPVTTAFFMMFSMLSLQGFRLTPTSAAGRILVCFWWIFAVVTIATYTASLGSFLFLTFPATMKPLPFYTFEQLAGQTQFQYGTVKAGATAHYFKLSDGLVEKKINNYFKENAHVMTASTTEGVRRVKAGGYAFIMESDSAHYEASRNCDLTVVGEVVGDRQYSFACRADTDICSKLDAEIIHLQHSGFINRLLDKWMSGQCGKYQEISKPTSYTPPTMSQFLEEKIVDMASFAFPLIWLSVGIVASIITMVIEIYCAGAKGSGGRSHRLPEDKRTFQDAVDMET